MLIRGDARYLPLRDGCVQCCITSPPYWGLRDYGTPGQIGLESSPAAYVSTLVNVFREVGRVLADDGSLWLNLGDSYVSGLGETGRNDQGSGFGRQPGNGQNPIRAARRLGPSRNVGLPQKNLVGIPWRVAFALQAAGWYLRSDIIWAKPNPMPESVTDRPTKAHEYLFLLTKAERYYYDAAAIVEASVGSWNALTMTKNTQMCDLGIRRTNGANTFHRNEIRFGRNKRTVWIVRPEPYSGAHFATMPEALIEPCLLAGCPLGGLVLDPFIGSGTVGAVAERTGRRWVGVDLAYQDIARARTAQLGLRFEAAC